jgi:hypothetical protein|tara:strand:- start:1216 stop:1404 length:189 start_codon:yes stop_codon:yes gene_type:complete
METNISIEQNKDYEDIISFFGTPKKVSEHFNISVQSIYQWRVEGVPETRLRELKLLKKLRSA